MAIDGFEHPALGAGPAVGAQRVDGAGGVQVPVLLLGSRDLGYEVVDVGFELRVGRDGEGVGGAFDDLVDVGVVEGVTGWSMVLEGLATKGFGGAEEIVDAAGLFILLESEGDGDFAVGLDAGRPEGVGDMDG